MCEDIRLSLRQHRFPYNRRKSDRSSNEAFLGRLESRHIAQGMTFGCYLALPLAHILIHCMLGNCHTYGATLWIDKGCAKSFLRVLGSNVRQKCIWDIE
jgi:hypothetical protein